MTDFNQAYAITMNNEGGYANDPNDHGGETWRGIARNFWPSWQGWSIVDNIKSQAPPSLNRALGANTQLEQLVLGFYKAEFWDCLSLSLLDNQQIADQLFDVSVNMGTGTAAKMLQEAINTYRNNSLTVDEKVGPLTITAANKLDAESLYNSINSLRKERYEGIIADNPSQAVFRNSWFSRIKPFNEGIQNMG